MEDLTEEELNQEQDDAQENMEVDSVDEEDQDRPGNVTSNRDDGEEQ